MLREILESTKKTFIYNNEEWQVYYDNNGLSISVDTDGTWTNVFNEQLKIRNEKSAIKKAKKIIDSFDQYK